MPLSYILIAITLLLTGGFSGWLISNTTTEQQPELPATTTNESLEVKATSTVTEPPQEKASDETQTTKPVLQKAEDPNIIIAKCKATKESSLDVATLKINQETEERLKVVFDSLNEQYEDAIYKLYASVDSQKSRIMNDDSLTATAKLNLIEQYNQDASVQAEKLYDNQQTFWENQKREIENNKETEVNKISISLNSEYEDCLKR